MTATVLGSFGFHEFSRFLFTHSFNVTGAGVNSKINDFYAQSEYQPRWDSILSFKDIIRK